MSKKLKQLPTGYDFDPATIIRQKGNPSFIDSESVVHIYLNDDKEALVDLDDYLELRLYTYHFTASSSDPNKATAMTWIYCGGDPKDPKNYKHYDLYNLIRDRIPKLPINKPHNKTDHIDGDRLNCTKFNLRPATSKQNAGNRHNRKVAI